MRLWQHKVNDRLSQTVMELRNGKWLGQLTEYKYVKTGHAYHYTDDDVVIDQFNTVEEALNAVGYPVDVAPIPEELRQ